MDESLTTKRLVVLRKLTRAIADFVRGQLKDHLTALGPILRQRTVFGEYVRSDTKETVKGAEAAFKEMQALYAKVATAKPFSLNELRSPMEVQSSALEFIPVEYVHAAKTETEAKTINVISPLKWHLCYAGFTPKRLRDLVADRNRTMVDVEAGVQHALMLNTVIARQAAVVKIFEALHYTITVGKAEGLGDLPIVTIASVVSTQRPADDLVIESTEMAGTDTFEEVVSLSDLANLRDPFREKLVELAKAQGETLA
jgi:hypothetical protein